MNAASAKPAYGGAIFDMHCHVLPGVDDGARSYGQAVRMLAHASAEGVSTLAATPHLVCDGSEKMYRQKILNAFETLKGMAGDAGISIRLVLGYEMMLSPSLLHVHDIAAFALDGTGRLLAEPHSAGRPAELDELLYNLEHAGYGLILAHPERNEWLARNFTYLAELADRGVLLQVNAGSIMGQWGRRVAGSAMKMAVQGMVHLIGSDAHSDETRAPDIRAAVSALADRIGQAGAEAIAFQRAEALLAPADGRKSLPV